MKINSTAVLKNTLIALFVLVCLYFIFIRIALQMVDATCTTRAIINKPSPDRNNKVIVTKESCISKKKDNKFDSEQIYIYIQNNTDREKIEIFAATITAIEDNSTNVEWLSNKDVLVLYSGLFPFKSEKVTSGIRIKLKDISTRYIFSNNGDVFEKKSLDIAKSKYPGTFESIKKVFVSKIELFDDINDFAATDDNVYEVRVVRDDGKRISILFVKPDSGEVYIIKE